MTISYQQQPPIPSKKRKNIDNDEEGHSSMDAMAIDGTAKENSTSMNTTKVSLNSNVGFDMPHLMEQISDTTIICRRSLFSPLQISDTSRGTPTTHISPLSLKYAKISL